MFLHRLRLMFWFLAMLFGLVAGKLAQLQFLTVDFWDAEARASRIGGEAIAFRRGGILDRYGRPLAEGETVHRLSFVLQDFRRDSPLGNLLGAGRLLAEAAGEELPTFLAVRQEAPARLAALLDLGLADLAGLEGREQEDLGFYVRRLLGQDAAEFQRWRHVLEPDGATFRDLAPERVAGIPAAFEEQEAALADLARAIGSSPEEFMARIEGEIAAVDLAVDRAIRAQERPPTRSQVRAIRRDQESRDRVLERNAPFKAVYLVELVPERYQGFRVEDVTRRVYPEASRDLSPGLVGWVGYPADELLAEAAEDERLFAELRSHATGSTDLGTAERIAAVRERIRRDNYLPDEEMGRAGLEALLEPVLRGRRGWRIAERDSARRDTKLIEIIEPVDGADVRLALDLDLQRAAERVLARHGRSSALVLLDPGDGAIRALATWPDPTREEIQSSYGDLLKDRRRPLFHRAFRPPGNPPPPGSVFKVVAAAAALEAGLIRPDTTFHCEKYLMVGRTQLKCMSAHGTIGLAEALGKSCNIWFYELSRELGAERMVAMARRLGMGQASGFGDPERLGLPPSALPLGEIPCPFQPGHGVLYAMRTAIGHAAVDDTTPLQVAAVMATFANGGRRVTPWLIDDIGGRQAPRTPPQPTGLAPATLAAIKEGMIAATTVGSARPRDGHDLRPYLVACKTGTPEAEGGADHAWIAGYFPHDRPRLAFAIYFEHSGEGGGAAGTPVLASLLAQPELAP